MKRDFLKIRKRLIVGCLAAAIAVAQPVSSVFANPHYERRCLLYRSDDPDEI